MNKIYEQLVKKGYCAVEYKHHPKKIKNAIKSAGFRPMAKECFANAQKLVSSQNDFYYAEGVVVSDIGIPFEHAWVMDKDDNHYDITINPMPKILCYKKYDYIQVLSNMRKTMLYTGVNWPWLETMKMASIMGIPLKMSFEEISEKINQQFSFLRKINESQEQKCT